MPSLPCHGPSIMTVVFYHTVSSGVYARMYANHPFLRFQQVWKANHSQPNDDYSPEQLHSRKALSDHPYGKNPLRVPATSSTHWPNSLLSRSPPPTEYAATTFLPHPCHLGHIHCFQENCHLYWPLCLIAASHNIHGKR